MGLPEGRLPDVHVPPTGGGASSGRGAGAIAEEPCDQCFFVSLRIPGLAISLLADGRESGGGAGPKSTVCPARVGAPIAQLNAMIVKARTWRVRFLVMAIPLNREQLFSWLHVVAPARAIEPAEGRYRAAHLHLVSNVSRYRC